MAVNDPEVGVAFALVIGAGAATALGAAVVFFPSLVKLASRRVLASALGISAGVMTYVSFVEIFQKSNSSFTDSGFSEEDAYLYSTLCFFAGVVAMLVVDFLVKCIAGNHGHSHSHAHHHHGHEEECEEEADDNVVKPVCPCCAEDPAGDLETMQHIAEDMSDVDIPFHHHEHHEHHEHQYHEHDSGEQQKESDSNIAQNTEIIDSTVDQEAGSSDVQKPSNQEKDLSAADTEEQRKLVKMGINTAIAIGLHNFPEGLATFVAALDDARVGGVLALAIGIHNIPEGLCVALPIYYATGNRWKSFCWALLSGASEPLAALLGWAVLANSFSDTLYAVLFGIVAGMMVVISTRELLPTAHRYDPEDTVVTYSFIGGMAIMALSLVLFTL